MATSSDTMRRRPLSQSQVWTLVLIVLGVAAFVIVGFVFMYPLDNAGRIYLPAPIYIYLSILLLALQGVTLRDRSPGHVWYVFLTSLAPLLFLGILAFTPPDAVVTYIKPILPYIYPIVNGLLLGVFFYDAINRRRRGLVAKVFMERMSASDAAGAPAEDDFPLFWVATAADLAGLVFLTALLVFLFSVIDVNAPIVLIKFLQSLIGRFGSFFVALHPAEKPQLQPPSLLGGPKLWLVNLVVLVCAIIGMAFSLLMSYLNIRRTIWATQVRKILGEAWTQLRHSLRLVISPLVWVFVAVIIFLFSISVVSSVATNARPADRSGIAHPDLLTFLQACRYLFIPLRHPLYDYNATLVDIVLGGVLAAVVIVAVAIVEPDEAVVQKTTAIIAEAIQRLAVVLLLFLVILIGINAIVILFGDNAAEPFQFGAPGSIVVAAIVIPWVVQRVRQRRRQPAA